MSLATTVYAALALLGTVAVVFVVQTADEGEITASDLGPPRAVARGFLETSLPPLSVLAAVTAVGVVVGDLDLGTLGLGPAARTPAAVAAGLGLGAGMSVLAIVQVWLLGRLGVSVEDTAASVYPDSYAGLGWYTVGYAGQSTMEEALFRAGLVGAVPAVIPVSPPLAVVLGAVAFGLAHADRAPGGVVVTATTGLVYGVGFLLFGLPAVAVGHTFQNLVDATNKRFRADSDRFTTPGEE
ncbi:CPBP family intramembrane glutamic endopeptidase [Halobaculum sp. MBLA0143]|uniref:CPBP family intramembrane glutamic endopeptidase n=1 Tax=Halobaculum sp. MBLA0143 TaxID=3079933 RepID=UPI003525C006